MLSAASSGKNWRSGDRSSGHLPVGRRNPLVRRVDGQEFAPLTDTDFLAAALEDGLWHSHTEILDRSLTLRGCGLTIHSRAADLRKRGHVVETRLERDQRGRTVSYYKLGVAGTATDDRLVNGGAAAGVAPGAIQDASPGDLPKAGDAQIVLAEGSSAGLEPSASTPSNPATDGPLSVEQSTRVPRDEGVLTLFEVAA